MRWERFTLGSLAILTHFLTLACAPMDTSRLDQMSQAAEDSLGCSDIKIKTWAEMVAIPLEEENFPSVRDLTKALSKRLHKAQEQGSLVATDQQLKEYVKAYVSLYEFITLRMQPDLKIKKSSELVEAMVAIELGDKTTSQRAKLQTEFELLTNQLESAAEQITSTCDEETTRPGPDPDSDKYSYLEHWESKLPSPVFGGLKVFSTAYQSCQVMHFLEPMDNRHPSVRGISIVGTHPSGTGLVREISSLSEVTQTHYYIRDYQQLDSSCHDLKHQPLIYDYGGKPAATTQMDSRLDFFRNAGTGSRELGVDCSGYVFAAYATAGLKMRADQPLRAMQVFGINSGMIKEPARNGLSCLEKVYGEIEPGDLIAISGHVVMVDEVLDDPFGIRNINSLSQCRLENFSSQSFNFIISQSSPSKGGIGLNRMLVSAYLEGSATMRNALRAHAVTACKAKFGVRELPNTTAGSIVRHKGTDNCMDRPILLAREECLSSCTSF